MVPLLQKRVPATESAICSFREAQITFVSNIVRDHLPEDERENLQRYNRWEREIVSDRRAKHRMGEDSFHRAIRFMGMKFAQNDFRLMLKTRKWGHSKRPCVNAFRGTGFSNAQFPTAPTKSRTWITGLYLDTQIDSEHIRNSWRLPLVLHCSAAKKKNWSSPFNDVIQASLRRHRHLWGNYTPVVQVSLASFETYHNSHRLSGLKGKYYIESYCDGVQWFLHTYASDEIASEPLRRVYQIKQNLYETETTLRNNSATILSAVESFLMNEIWRRCLSPAWTRVFSPSFIFVPVGTRAYRF